MNDQVIKEHDLFVWDKGVIEPIDSYLQKTGISTSKYEGASI